MYMSATSSSQPFEIIATHSLEVICDGGDGALGHPRVFLHIDRETNEITCPYCSRQYVYHADSRSTAA